MFDTEEKLWWYRILHEKVLNIIVEIHKDNKNIKILDAGCGTGGMMQFLKLNGYRNIEGFDFSVDAVNFCLERNLDVKQLDVTKLSDEYTEGLYDIVINNDVLYQFENQEVKLILSTLTSKLKKNGILISNNQALNIFYGTHDIAVGAKRRFSLTDFENLLKNQNQLYIKYSNYWSLFLSPLILFIRLIQQTKLKLNLIDLKKVNSDVDLPSPFINNLLYKIVKFEEKMIKRSFFGSSLFIMFQKK